MKKNALMIAVLGGALVAPAAALAACRTGGADAAPAPAPSDSLQTGIALFQREIGRAHV